jgi:hypothetical protein
MIIWNRSGFDIVARLPNDTEMNNPYFVTNLLIPFEHAIFARGRAPHERLFVIHLDICSVQTSRVSRDWLRKHIILRMPHPPYPADLASSDFYLFPPVNEKLERFQLGDEDQFFWLF